jgi:type II secretory pathway component PulC
MTAGLPDGTDIAADPADTAPPPDGAHPFPVDTVPSRAPAGAVGIGAGLRAAMLVALSLVAGNVVGDELRLVGTRVQMPDPEGRSQAVFERGSGETIALRPGESVAGCRLIEVAARAARLRCADGAVTVELREGLADRRAAGPREESGPAATYAVTLPREAFPFARTGHGQLPSQLSLEPAIVDGRLRGYRIAWIREGGDFHRLGLRNGDVIVSLNGAVARDPGTLVQAVNELRGVTRFELGLEREGEHIEYSYRLR